MLHVTRLTTLTLLLALGCGEGRDARVPRTDMTEPAAIPNGSEPPPSDTPSVPPPPAGPQQTGGESCEATRCAAELAACASDCQALARCIVECNADDEACVDGCITRAAAPGFDQLASYLQCADARCSEGGSHEEAPSSPPPSAPPPPEMRPARIDVIHSCYAGGTDELYVAPCADASYGQNHLEVGLGARQRITLTGEPGCYDIWAIDEDGVEKGNSVTLRRGETVTVGTCGGAEFDVALMRGFSSRVKGTLADTLVRIEIVNHCAGSICQVHRSECGTNQWERADEGGGWSAPSNRMTTLERQPIGCYDYRFTPCLEYSYDTWNWRNTNFSAGDRGRVALCGP